MDQTNTIALISRATAGDAGSRSSDRLRIGVLVPRGPLPAWTAHLLAQLKQCNFTDPILIVDAQSVVEHRAALNQMFFRLWRKWDRRFFKAGDGKEPSLTFLDDISRLEIATARGDVEELFSANLDVL